MGGLVLDILVKFPGIKKKKIPEEEKNPNSLTSKEEETNGHQTSRAKQV